MRPCCVGPRSLMVTITLFWFVMLVTLSLVPNGSVLWAAVSWLASYRCPLEVL